MATGTMATAAGAAMLLYYVLSRRLAVKDEEDDRDGDLSKSSRSGRRKNLRRPAQAPSTWFEAIATLSETLRFTYSETLGKWPIGDLAFGINYMIRRQGNLQVASVYAGSDSVQLKGPEIRAELTYLLRLLSLCMFFSKKPFPVFLELGGYSQEDVLLQEPKAGLLRPAFTILCDKNSKCFLLLIRGTHSIKDTLTAATGAVVPFHHSVLHEGGISNLVLGYAHCGMVAAARWIAKCCSPCLIQALTEHPEYKVKIVGHSLGGGTAALLTYILRERKEFSSTTCVTFAPAACMTWDLAESGKHFITTIINGSDLVPTFSTASIDDLRSEVNASSWVSDLRDQVEHTRILNVVYRSASALGSRLPTIASAKARVSSAGALLRPVSSTSQVVMKRAQNVAQAVVRTRSSFSSWSCMGARRRPVAPTEDTVDVDGDTDTDTALIPSPEEGDTTDEEVSTGELWYELERELHEGEVDAQDREEEEAAAKEITEEEETVVERKNPEAVVDGSDGLETQRFYPPGRIMHIVCVAVPPPSDEESCEEDGGDEGQVEVGIYDTPRDLYSKLRLSRTMINDHYMPMYKKMMEMLINQLEKDEELCINNNNSVIV